MTTSDAGDATAMRKRILGSDYVDSQRERASDPVAEEFQDFLTQFAWGVWTRGVLTTRDRSLLVLAIAAALGRDEEFKLHLRSAARAGVRPEELDELAFQLAAYAGAPAGLSARRAIDRLREEIG